MAQHASPNEAGHDERARDQLTRSSSLPVMTLWDSPPNPSSSTSLTMPMLLTPCAISVRTCAGGCYVRGGYVDPTLRGFAAVGHRQSSLGADTAHRGVHRAFGRHHGGVGGQIARPPQRTPVEASSGDFVHEGEEEHRGEREDGPEPVVAERRVRHRVRVEEDDLDVEHDEQHRHDVEAHREALGRFAARHDPALVRGLLGRRRPARRQQARRREAEHAEHHGEQQQHDDREVLAHQTPASTFSRSGSDAPGVAASSDGPASARTGGRGSSRFSRRMRSRRLSRKHSARKIMPAPMVSTAGGWRRAPRSRTMYTYWRGSLSSMIGRAGARPGSSRTGSNGAASATTKWGVLQKAKKSRVSLILG